MKMSVIKDNHKNNYDKEDNHGNNYNHDYDNHSGCPKTIIMKIIMIMMIVPASSGTSVAFQAKQRNLKHLSIREWISEIQVQIITTVVLGSGACLPGTRQVPHSALLYPVSLFLSGDTDRHRNTDINTEIVWFPAPLVKGPCLLVTCDHCQLPLSPSYSPGQCGKQKSWKVAIT